MWTSDSIHCGKIYARKASQCFLFSVNFVVKLYMKKSKRVFMSLSSKVFYTEWNILQTYLLKGEMQSNFLFLFFFHSSYVKKR